jgi:Toprim domain
VKACPVHEALVERARRADLLATAKALGATLKPISRVEVVGACVRCGGTDRFSVHVKKGVWNCRGANGGRDAIGLVAHVRGLDLSDAENFRAVIEELTAESTPEPVQSKPAAPKSRDIDEAREAAGKLENAARIVAELVPIIKSPEAMRYLHEVRKIDVDEIADVLERVDAIGWHPAVYFNEPEHQLHHRKVGCIIGVMTDPITAKPTGAISRTYLAPDLTKIGKAKTLGTPAGIIRLDLDEEVLGGLHIAEGLESALDGMMRGYRPMWAMTSTAIMSHLPVLDGVERLTILADRDEHRAGEIAAADAAERWRDAGRAVTIKRRKNGLGDINDATREAR